MSRNSLALRSYFEKYLSHTLAFLLVAGWAQSSWAGTESDDRRLTEPLASAYNGFGFNLFSELAKAHTNEGCFISPASLAFALSMLQEGAQGQTETELARVLQLPWTNKANLRAANAVLFEQLKQTDAATTLEIANGLWIRQGTAIMPDFIARNQQFYKAQVATADFNSPTTVKQINSWVSQNTHAKIQEIVSSPLDPALELLLLDAVYFKGTWETPFKPELTKDMPFNLKSGKQIKHPRMMREDRFDYLEGQGFQAVRLPYGRNGAVNMVIILPRKSSSLNAFMQKLTAKNWQQWMNGFHEQEGSLGLPRFKQEHEYKLNGALASAGLWSAFDAKRANFRGMSAESLFVSKVMQKTFVEVNEKGTEAAAVTGIESLSMGIHNESPPKPFSMIVDRPFFVAVRDNRTGLILFMGTILDPR